MVYVICEQVVAMRSSLSFFWQLASQQGILGANQSHTLLCARAKLKKKERKTADNLVLNQVYSVQIKVPLSSCAILFEKQRTKSLKLSKAYSVQFKAPLYVLRAINYKKQKLLARA
jgi:hypothetical protein